MIWSYRIIVRIGVFRKMRVIVEDEDDFVVEADYLVGSVVVEFLVFTVYIGIS